MINVGSFVINNWIYKIDSGYVLIDTGYEEGFLSLKMKLAKHNISIEQIRYIFLTHAHDDHAGYLNNILSECSQIKVIMHETALDGLYRGQNSFVGGCSTRLALMFCNILKLIGKGDHRFPPLKKEFENRCIRVTDANRNEIGTLLNGKIISTFGHTADSISLLLNDGSFFCGDAAMNGFPSTHRITLAPKKIYPSHGKPFPYADLVKNIDAVSKIKLRPLNNG